MLYYYSNYAHISAHTTVSTVLSCPGQRSYLIYIPHPVEQNYSMTSKMKGSKYDPISKRSPRSRMWLVAWVASPPRSCRLCLISPVESNSNTNPCFCISLSTAWTIPSYRSKTQHYHNLCGWYICYSGIQYLDYHTSHKGKCIGK